MYCSAVTTAKARVLAQAFAGPGLVRTGPYSVMDWRLEYNFEVSPSNTLNVYFEPYLPHGEVTCSACG